MKDKNYISISVDTSIWQNQASFHDKPVNKLRIKENYFSLIKVIYERLLYWSVKKNILFIPTLRTRQGYLSSFYSAKHPSQNDFATKKIKVIHIILVLCSWLIFV